MSILQLDHCSTVQNNIFLNIKDICNKSTASGYIMIYREINALDEIMCFRKETEIIYYQVEKVSQLFIMK